MSTSVEEELEGEEEEVAGESPRNILGEGVTAYEVVIQDKTLTFEEASKCLNTLGKDESCMRYAYIRFTACDQKLTNIKVLLNFRHVLFVDVSGNYLRTEAIQEITSMPFMIQLHAQRNFIDNCALKPMCFLQDLSLARNRICDTIGIIQPSLEYLDLNYNQIYQAILHSEDLPELKELEMRGNFLFECNGTLPISLKKLYLAENKISHMVDLDRMENLQVLHLRQNFIKKLNGFTSKLKNLKYLNLRNNKINKLRQLRKLQCLPMLEVLIVKQNPVSNGMDLRDGKAGGEFDEELGEIETAVDPDRVGILVLLPNLKRINKTLVTFEERQRAHIDRVQKLQEILDVESSDDDIEPTSTSILPGTDNATDIADQLSYDKDGP